MISEIVDRVARAMHNEEWPDAGPMYEFGLPTADHWRKLARAATAAMREPTADMVRCGLGCGWGIMGLNRYDVIAGWQAMIDEALVGEKACLPGSASPADRVGGTAP